jgi:hypothetical protein
MEDDLSLKELEQYCGTMAYHRVLGANVTDGVAYIMRNGYSWLVTDALALVRFNDKMNRQPFICIKLRLLPDKKAIVTYTDGNENLLDESRLEYTTAQRELTLYFTDQVLLLSGEY